MPAELPLIELSEVSKRYETPSGGDPLTVLDRVSLAVVPGESVAVVGPSGCGKSTLLHIMGTLDRPSSGQVRLAGTDIGTLGQVELAAIRNGKVGFVFQAHYLLPQCTVLENVLVPTLAKPGQASTKRSRAETAEERALRLLKRVGLGERIDHLPGQLSGGERQRAAVVRALIHSPRLLLADEPTGSLDEGSAASLTSLLLELNREENAALVVVTHSREVASRMGRMLRLRAGRLEQQLETRPASASP